MTPPSARRDVSWIRTDTRLGGFLLACRDGKLVRTALPGTRAPEFVAALRQSYPDVEVVDGADVPVLRDAAKQLAEYGEGKRTEFNLPLLMEGTEFQKRVWVALAAIPYGATRSYQDIAREVGRPGASRAVGQANHDNPLAPIVPCHRVITSTGNLGGYGGGMDLKRALLRHEGIDF